MQDDQLKLLETRINKAIAFIETLKSREKKLLQEKDELTKKIVSLENGLEEKDNKIKELIGSQEFLKEKIETILGKLESFASIEPEEEFVSMNSMDTSEIETEKEYESILENKEETIVEEDMVDYKKEGEEGEPVLLNNEGSVQQIEEMESISSDESGESHEQEKKLTDELPEKNQSSLFNDDLNTEKLFDESDESEGTDQDLKVRWIGNNPFIDT